MQARRARDVFTFVALFSLWTGDGMRDALSWWGFGAVSLALVIASVWVIVLERRRLRALLWHSRAIPVAAFIAVCLVSVTWSKYPAMTLVGSAIQIATAVVAIGLVLANPVGRLIGTFCWMLHANLALSLVFELIVPFLPGGRLMPFFTDYGADAPGPYAWSQGLLFTGERIQGIVGNANLTCFLALLALITIITLAVAGHVRLRLLIPAIALDLLMITLTRSATVLVAGVVVAAVAGIILGYRHVRGPGRIGIAAAALALVVLAALSTSRAFDPVMRLLGKGDDLTGRLEIWHVVGQLVIQHPYRGWGWISYWAPWVDPFQHLIVRSGVQYLQAHNAFLDIELQVGLPGLAAFALLIGSIGLRSVRLAAVRAPLTMYPLLITTALLVQALAESRLLIEGNWAALVMLSIVLPWGTKKRLPPEGGPSQSGAMNR